MAMSPTEEIADLATEVRYDRLPEDVRAATKRRVLDAIGVGLRSRAAGRNRALRRTIEDRAEGTESGDSRLWGATTAPSSPAALHNAVLAGSGNGAVFLSPTLSPAYGPLAAVLTVSEAEGTTGAEALSALAVALEVHGELAWNAPLDGLGPATHASVATAAGVGAVTGLDSAEIRRAVGLTASRVALAVDGDGFSPLASGLGAREAIEACRLVSGGVDAPDAISAPNGWRDLVGPFDLDPDPGCGRVHDAAVSPYDAQPHAQSAIEAAIGIANGTAIDPAEIDGVTVETVERAVRAIDAERIAAALVDRSLFVHRAERADLRPIVEATDVSAVDGSIDNSGGGTAPARVTVETRTGDVHERTAEGFEGDPTTPVSWGTVEEKFHASVEGIYGRERREEIIETVRSFEAETPVELARLLG